MLKLNLTGSEKAYLAGIVDGEGCLSLRRGKKTSYALRLTVVSTCRPLISWIKLKVGGNLYSRNIRHINSNTKDYWVWCTGNQDIIEAITITIQPYLIVKRAQAKLVLLYIKLRGRRGERIRRFTIYKALQRLNQRGYNDEQLEKTK